MNDASCSYAYERIDKMKVIVTDQLVELEASTDIIEVRYWAPKLSFIIIYP